MLEISKLDISYRFKGLPYLVADAEGEFYILPHCKHRRSSRFKKLKNNPYVYYDSMKLYKSRLRDRHIKVKEQIKIELS